MALDTYLAYHAPIMRTRWLLMPRRLPHTVAHAALVLLYLCANLRVRAVVASARVLPERTETTVGQTFEVRMVVENVVSFYGVDVRLSFDPSLLEVLDADTRQTGIQVQEGQFPYPDFVVRNKVDNSQGTIWYAITQLSPREPVNGTGTVLTAQLRARATGTALIGIIQGQFVNNAGVEIEVQTSGAEVAISGADGSTPPPAEATPSRTATWTPTGLPTSAATSTPQPATAGSPTHTGAPFQSPTMQATSSGTVPPLPTHTSTPETGTPTIVSPSPKFSSTPTAEGAPIESGSPTALPKVTSTVLPTGGVSPVPSVRPTARGSATPTRVRPSYPATAPAVPPAGTPVGTSAPSAVAAVPTFAAATPVDATPAPTPGAGDPLVPNEVFFCGMLLLVLFTLLLLQYVVAQGRDTPIAGRA